MMNAGAYGSEMKNVVTSVRVMDRGGEIHILDNEQMEFGYRTSCVARLDYVVLEAVMALEPGDAGEIRMLTPARAPTPGQLAVFYDGDAVVGSAWIV